ncbi:MAG: hypothetical protein AB1665_09300 [Candidatus Thermoplasmatota archaeon]
MIFILTRHKAKLYAFLDPVIDDIAQEMRKEVREHDREWIKGEVERRLFEAGVYIFTEMGKRMAKEMARDILSARH